MFIPIRDTDVRRRKRIYIRHDSAGRSKTSLSTVETSSSGGSNSTVTQESYNKSQHRSRRKRPRERSTRKSQQEDQNKSVDVFDFLVDDKSKLEISPPIDEDVLEDRSDNESEDDSVQGDGSGAAELESVVHLDESDPEADPEGYYRSMSDSGISMGSGCSSVSGFPALRLPVLLEEPFTRPPSQHGTSTELALADPRWTWPNSSPQLYAESYIPPPVPYPPPAVVYDALPYSSQPSYTPYGTPSPMPEQEARSPSLLVREPKGHSAKPACFRSFAKLSTRLLLQLQDDIADLEEELKRLDNETDGAHREAAEVNMRESRQRERRADEIYGELHAKIDNYYHALEMMHKVDNISSPAATSDLTTYHKWLDSRIAEPSKVRRLVGSDLRRFSTRKAEHISLSTTFQPQYLAYCAMVYALLPLMMFKLFLGVLNRLVVLALVVVAGGIVQDRLRTKIGREELTCTLICICISAFAAIFL